MFLEVENVATLTRETVDGFHLAGKRHPRFVSEGARLE